MNDNDTMSKAGLICWVRNHMAALDRDPGKLAAAVTAAYNEHEREGSLVNEVALRKAVVEYRAFYDTNEFQYLPPELERQALAAAADDLEGWT